MPPWFASPEYGHFANDARLSPEEKNLLHEWVKNGCPRGDDHDLPPPRQFATGWQMGEPDQVIYMRDEPVKVPAEGVVSYQYFVVDPGWTEDKWVQAAEAAPRQPCCRASHHRLCAAAGTARRRLPRRWWPGGLCPGGPSANLSAGRRGVRAGGVEDRLPDALYAQWNRSTGPQLHRPAICRSRDSQKTACAAGRR